MRSWGVCSGQLLYFVITDFLSEVQGGSVSVLASLWGGLVQRVGLISAVLLERGLAGGSVI